MNRHQRHISSLSGRWLRLGIQGVLLLLISAAASASPFLYVADNANGTVSVIDAATNTVVKTIAGLDAPNGVAITPDGSRVYVASPGADTIYVISTSTKTLTSSFLVMPPGYGYPFSPWGMVFSPDGTRLYVTTGLNQAIVVVNAENDTPLSAIIGAFDDPKAIAITPNGSLLYVVNTDPGAQSVSVVSTATDTITQTIYGFSLPVDVAIDAKGAYAYIANDPSGGGAVSVLDLATNTVSADIYGFSGASATVIGPDGTVAYELTDQASEIAEFSTTTNTLLAGSTIYVLGGIPNSMAITPGTSPMGYVTLGGNGTGAVDVISIANNSVVDTITTDVDNPAGIVVGP